MITVSFCLHSALRRRRGAHTVQYTAPLLEPRELVVQEPEMAAADAKPTDVDPQHVALNRDRER